MSETARMLKLIETLSDAEYWALMDIVLREARKEINAPAPEPEPRGDLNRLLSRNFLKENR